MKKNIIIILLSLFSISCSKLDSKCTVSYFCHIKEHENFVNRNEIELEIIWTVSTYGLCNSIDEMVFDNIRYAVFEFKNQTISYTYCVDSLDVKKTNPGSSIDGELLIDWSTYEMSSNGQLGVLVDFMNGDLIVYSFYFFGNYRTDHEFIEFVETDTNNSINESMREAMPNE